MLFDDECADLAARRDGEADAAVACFDLDDQRAEHVDSERLAALPILGVACHRRRDMVVDPVAGALVVIVGTAAANREGADLADGWHGHEGLSLWVSRSGGG